MTNYKFRFHYYGEDVYVPDEYEQERYLIRNKNGIAWTCCEHDINTDINDIIRSSVTNNISFDELFSHCISHEIIHNILYDEFGRICTIKFDNMCSGKRVPFKYWIGGMV